jgi:putative transposase
VKELLFRNARASRFWSAALFRRFCSFSFDAAISFSFDQRQLKSKRRKSDALQRDPMDDLRLRLIERLCRLPQSQLTAVEALMVRLDQDSVGAAANRVPAAPSVAHAPHSDWPHAPVHRLSEHGTFIVTASTLRKEHLFRGPEKLTVLEDMLLRLAKQHEIVLEAWAVFSNHYHFVAYPAGTENALAAFIARLHYDAAQEINRRDGCQGRQVWFNYWDTQLTFERSYLARLNYVHQNAVKHGLVARANEYRWCSAAWFEQVARPAQVTTVYGFRTDRVKIDDDYEPVL